MFFMKPGNSSFFAFLRRNPIRSLYSSTLLHHFVQLADDRFFRDDLESLALRLLEEVFALAVSTLLSAPFGFKSYGYAF